MHNGAVFAKNSRGHGVELLDERENWSDKNVKGKNPALNIHHLEGGAKTPRAIKGLFRWGSVNIIHLDFSTKQNAKVLVGVDNLDQRPARVLNKKEFGCESLERAILGAKDDSFVTINAKT
jgi:hypothetical protein